MANPYDIWTGHKVRIRSVSADDADAFFADGQDSEVARRCDEIHLPTHPAQLRSRLEASPADSDEHRWLAIESKSDGQLAGSLTVKHAPRFGHHFSYGIAIFRDNWHNGYASEAIALLLRYQFRELRMHYVYATVWGFNEPSIALHEALGFQREGRLREVYFSNGQYHDEIWFGMLAREFLDSALERSLPAVPPLL